MLGLGGAEEDVVAGEERATEEVTEGFVLAVECESRAPFVN